MLPRFMSEVSGGDFIWVRKYSSNTLVPPPTPPTPATTATSHSLPGLHTIILPSLDAEKL